MAKTGLIKMDLYIINNTVDLITLVIRNKRRKFQSTYLNSIFIIIRFILGFTTSKAYKEIRNYEMDYIGRFQLEFLRQQLLISVVTPCFNNHMRSKKTKFGFHDYLKCIHPRRFIVGLKKFLKLFLLKILDQIKTTSCDVTVFKIAESDIQYLYQIVFDRPTIIWLDAI